MGITNNVSVIANCFQKFITNSQLQLLFGEFGVILLWLLREIKLWGCDWVTGDSKYSLQTFSVNHKIFLIGEKLLGLGVALICMWLAVSKEFEEVIFEVANGEKLWLLPTSHNKG